MEFFVGRICWVALNIGPAALLPRIAAFVVGLSHITHFDGAHYES